MQDATAEGEADGTRGEDALADEDSLSDGALTLDDI
jgi:hypothetical protein